MDSAKVRVALEAALSSRPILRTVLADLPDGTLFHVVCRPEKHFFDRVIQQRTVESDQEALQLLSEDTATHAPRLMASIQIITVPATGAIYLSLTYSHSVFDVLSIIPFHSDLDRLMRSDDPLRSPIPSLTPFKLFADLYYLYRDSLLSRGFR